MPATGFGVYAATLRDEVFAAGFRADAFFAAGFFAAAFFATFFGVVFFFAMRGSLHQRCPRRNRRGADGRQRASLRARGSRLISASRRRAAERSGCRSLHRSLTGRRVRVYFDATPRPCWPRRRGRSFEMPV